VTPRPKDDSSEKALLESARKLFYQRGFHAVSTRDIAVEAKVNLGSIQYHYGSKQNLFIAAVRSLLEETGCKEGRNELSNSLNSKEEAAVGLVTFLYGMLNYFIRPTGPQVCRLMFREVLGAGLEEENLKDILVEAVLKDFYEPWIDTIKNALLVINPSLSEEVLRLHTYSIIGQCSFYITDRPFAESLEKKDFSEESFFQSVVEHIAKNSLRGVEYEDSDIKDAIKIGILRGKEIIKGCT